MNTELEAIVSKRLKFNSVHQLCRWTRSLAAALLYAIIHSFLGCAYIGIVSHTTSPVCQIGLTTLAMLLSRTLAKRCQPHVHHYTRGTTTFGAWLTDAHNFSNRKQTNTIDERFIDDDYVQNARVWTKCCIHNDNFVFIIKWIRQLKEDETRIKFQTK